MGQWKITVVGGTTATVIAEIFQFLLGLQVDSPLHTEHKEVLT